MYYTTYEIADKLKITRFTIYSLLKKGMPYIIVGKRKRFNWEEVQEWLKNKN